MIGTDLIYSQLDIQNPPVTGDDTPCSLSRKMVTEILRGDLGYDGIIVTDAMNMGAIVEQYTSGAGGAIHAGAVKPEESGYHESAELMRFCAPQKKTAVQHTAPAISSIASSALFWVRTLVSARPMVLRRRHS